MEPELSVVIAAFDMSREVPRTVHSFSRLYQREVDDLEYEVVVVDNDSPKPLDVPAIERICPEVRVVRLEGLGVSPAKAVNRAVASTSGRYIGIVLDGARLVTPGVLALARKALDIDDRLLVTTLAWHLGTERQDVSWRSGYSQAVEDGLIDSIGWPADGYRLFDIAVLAHANPRGWFGPINESSCTFLSRDLFEALGGYDEAFSSPGGGYVNLDFFSRACKRNDDNLIVLLGEGSFHQFHGGISSNATNLSDVQRSFLAEYEMLRGHSYQYPRIDPIYLGRVPSSTLRWMEATSREV